MHWDDKDEEFVPLAILEDGDGARIEVYGDGSYVTKRADGRLL
jgi:hypothetical protein